MEVAPNSPRPGVIGGFAIVPPAVQASSLYFNPSGILPPSTTPGSGAAMIGLYAAGGFTPQIGQPVEFTPGWNSGLPLVTSAANYVGTTTYGLGAMVSFYGVLYASLQAGNIGNSPSSSPTWWTTPNFRGVWQPDTVYAVLDVVLALDSNNVLQTWFAPTSFTSGPTFSSTGWTEALVAGQLYYVVALGVNTFSISASLGGGAITFTSYPFGTGGVTALFGVDGFGRGTGLVPALTVGALFAQGTLWQPTGPPSVAAAPANALSWLGYNSSTGLYWTSNPLGNTSGDAVLGWVKTDATDIIAASVQNVPVEQEAGASGGAIPATPSVLATMPPTPTSGIASAGGGEVTFDAITFAIGVDTSSIDSAIIVLLYQPAAAPATAHLTAALTNTATTGAPATLSTDTNLTGIVEAGDWLLIGGEMIFVTANATSSSLATERALGLTVAENHAIGAPIYLLSTAVFPYLFPPLFFLNPDYAAGWGPTEQLPNANIALFNIVVLNSGGGESNESPINYSQSMGGLIATGVAGGSSGALAHALVAVVAAAAALNFALYRSMAVNFTMDTAISPFNTTGLGPFLWVLQVFQDAMGGHQMIPSGGITAALSTAQSPPNSFVTGLFFYDGAGNHILLASTGDQPIP